MFDVLFDSRIALVSTLSVMGPLYFLCILTEVFYFKRKGILERIYSKTDSVTSIALTMLYQFGEIIAGFILVPIYSGLFNYRIFTIPITWWPLDKVLLTTYLVCSFFGYLFPY